MTHACCPDCRLRLTTASTAGPLPCPACGRPLEPASAADVLGWPLMRTPPAMSSAAIAAALALPDPQTPTS